MAGAPIGALLAAACVELAGLQATLIAFGVVYLVCTLSPLVVPAWRDRRTSRAGLELRRDERRAGEAVADAGRELLELEPEDLGERGERGGLHLVDARPAARARGPSS